MKPSFFIRSVVTALLSQQISKVNTQEKINAKLNCFFAVFCEPCGGEPNLSHRRTTSLEGLVSAWACVSNDQAKLNFQTTCEVVGVENHSNMTADERKARIGSMHAWYCTFAPCELTEHSCFRPRWWVLNPKAAQAGRDVFLVALTAFMHAYCACKPQDRGHEMKQWERGSQCAFWCKLMQAASTQRRARQQSAKQVVTLLQLSFLCQVNKRSPPLYSAKMDGVSTFWFKLALFFCFSEHLRCFFSPADGNTCFWHSWLRWCGNCENGIGRVWLPPGAPAAAVAAPVIGKCINCLHWREEMVDIIVWHAGRFHYVNA